MSSLIDGYAHIGLPRFQSAEAWTATMDTAGISHALVCPFETCPDLVEVHRAYTLQPGRIRPFGLALGNERSEIEGGMHAQHDAGFIGFRLAETRIDEVPFVLDLIGERRGIPLVVGSNGLSSQASRLLGFLDRFPDSIIVSPHLAGPTDAGIFEDDAAVKALFEHPNFYVVMTRPGIADATMLRRWIEALIAHVGWDRLLWGSEAPVLYWRDWTIETASNWIGDFKPTPTQRANFESGNAQRAIFSQPHTPPQSLKLPYDPFAHEVKRTAPMFPLGFNADSALPAKLVARWMAAGGPKRETLTEFTSRLLLEAVQ